jgi:hypothetical protein
MTKNDKLMHVVDALDIIEDEGERMTILLEILSIVLDHHGLNNISAKFNDGSSIEINLTKGNKENDGEENQV